MNSPRSSPTRAQIFSGAVESRRHLRVAKAARWHEANAERVLQGDFAMRACRRFWQASEEVEAHPQMTLGLDISRTLHRALACLEPIVDRLLDAAGLGAVVAQSALARLRFGKLCFEHIGDASVKRASRLAQQSAVGRVLHKCVLEQIGRVRRYTLSEQQTRCDETVECGL